MKESKERTPAAEGGRKRGEDKERKRTYLQQLHRLAVPDLGLGPVHVEIQFSRIFALLGRHRQPSVLRGKDMYKCLNKNI